jgi:hypothetical protein
MALDRPTGMFFLETYGNPIVPEPTAASGSRSDFAICDFQEWLSIFQPLILCVQRIY